MGSQAVEAGKSIAIVAAQGIEMRPLLTVPHPCQLEVAAWQATRRGCGQLMRRRLPCFVPLPRTMCSNHDCDHAVEALQPLGVNVLAWGCQRGSVDLAPERRGWQLVTCSCGPILADQNSGLSLGP